jgi:hypothetical protein
MDNAQAQQILSTTDYDRFVILDTNRSINPGHAETLKQAFEEHGNLTAVQPLIVNERMEVIDGQHRLTAARELGVPVFYRVIEGLRISDARTMNILHRGWTIKDWADSYAASGNVNYQRFLALLEAHELPMSIVLYAVRGYKASGAFKQFRDGELVITSEAMAEATKRLDMIAELAEMNSLASVSNFAVAYMQALSNEGFDHKLFMQRLERVPFLLTRQAGVPEYLQTIENIYNYNLVAKNRMRLF